MESLSDGSVESWWERRLLRYNQFRVRRPEKGIGKLEELEANVRPGGIGGLRKSFHASTKEKVVAEWHLVERFLPIQEPKKLPPGNVGREIRPMARQNVNAARYDFVPFCAGTPIAQINRIPLARTSAAAPSANSLRPKNRRAPAFPFITVRSHYKHISL